MSTSRARLGTGGFYYGSETFRQPVVDDVPIREGGLCAAVFCGQSTLTCTVLKSLLLLLLVRLVETR
ncbi:MAG: hypothetical protein MHM6MM_004132 [Cercozoa sp. M6MM]